MINPIFLSQLLPFYKKQKSSRVKKTFSSLLSSSTLSSQHSLPQHSLSQHSPHEHSDTPLDTQNTLVQHLLRVKELSSTPHEKDNNKNSPLSSYHHTSRVVKDYALSKHGTKEQNNIEVIIDDDNA